MLCKLNAIEIEGALSTNSLARTIHILDSVDSTNTYAKKLAVNGCAHGCMVLAERQTKGHGKYGRVWHCDPKKNIAMSLVLRPDIPVDKSGLITIAVCVAVKRALKTAAAVDTKIKWPNDLMLNSKKICGILTEASLSSSGIRFAVVGIGVNVNQTSFKKEISDIATSLKLETGADVDRNYLCACIANEVEFAINCFESGNIQELMADYLENSCTIGNEISMSVNGNMIHGRAEKLDELGALIIATSDGKKSRIVSGEY